MTLKATPNSNLCPLCGNQDVAKGKISVLVATLVLMEYDVKDNCESKNGNK